ncbi:unnamed protein product [Lactuca virosa]|uniref:Uncharacterized protein n=1 Tax=Lactuca virosa TaxID=75947 RepID=A0AAU9PVV1_9ASTR|nr:unnamed protein product [Lactuca virosa]
MSFIANLCSVEFSLHRSPTVPLHLRLRQLRPPASSIPPSRWIRPMSGFDPSTIGPCSNFRSCVKFL